MHESSSEFKSKNSHLNSALDDVTEVVVQPDDGAFLQLLTFHQLIMLGGENTLLNEVTVRKQDSVSLIVPILSIGDAYIGQPATPA